MFIRSSLRQSALRGLTFAFRATLFRFMLMCAPLGVAETYTFAVTDKMGTPLPHAAIILPGTIVEPAAEIAIMDQIDVSFAPRLLVIQQGQRVSFPNSDRIRHHVYSFSPAKAFEIRLYAGTPKAPLLFDQAGIVVLGCNIHDSMVGYIVVADSPYAGSTDEKGLVTLRTASAVDRLRIWHPLLATTTTAPLELSMPAANARQASNTDMTRVVVLDVEMPAAATKKPNTFKSRYQR